VTAHLKKLGQPPLEDQIDENLALFEIMRERRSIYYGVMMIVTAIIAAVGNSQEASNKLQEIHKEFDRSLFGQLKKTNNIKKAMDVKKFFDQLSKSLGTN